MSEKRIKLNGAKDAGILVKAAENCNFDVDLSYDRIVVDAKSLMGVLSLDLRRVLTVRYHDEGNKELDKVLAAFAV